MSFTSSIRNAGISLIAVTISLGGLSACSDGGSSAAPTFPPGGTNPPPPPAGDIFTLNGSASKGLIFDGNVEIRNALDPSVILASGKTDSETGAYDVTIDPLEGFFDAFVYVVVTGGNGAEMLCDSPTGCLDSNGEHIDFGNKYAIDSTVSLSAIIPVPRDTQTVHVNILTDLVSAYTQIGSSTDETQRNLDHVNAQVADLFGIVTSDLTTIPAIDLSASTLSITDLDTFRAALISAGSMGALMEPGSNLGANLDLLRSTFVSQNGQLIVNEAVDDPNVISLEDIFGSAVDVISMSGLDSEAFRTAAAQILGDSLTILGQPTDTLSQAGPAPSSTLPPLDQAKAFVDDLQLIIQAVDAQETENDLNNFAERVEASANLIADDADSALQSIMEGLRVIGEAYEALQADNSITGYTARGFDVVISGSADNTVLEIDNTIHNGNTVNLTVQGYFDLITSETENTATFELGADASVTGSSENDLVNVNITNGQIIIKEANGQSVAEYFPESPGNFTTTDIALRAAQIEGTLDATIEHKISNGLKFEGIVNAELQDASLDTFTESGSVYHLPNLPIEIAERDLNIGAVGLGLSGKLSEGGKSINVTFGFKADGENVSIHDKPVFEDLYSYSIENNKITQTTDTETVVYELISYSTAEDEIEAIGGSLSGSSLIYDEFGRLIAVRIIGFPDDQVFKYHIDRINPEGTDITVYIQGRTKSSFFGTFPADGFIGNEPTKIVDYYNGFFNTPMEEPYISCYRGQNDPTFKLFLIKDTVLQHGGGTIQGAVLKGDNGKIFSCSDLYNYASSLSSRNQLTLNPDLSSTGLITGSIRQNIVGIDPNDPEVSIKAYGPVSYQNETVEGAITLQLDFAGRRFETDARDIHIIDDLTEPVTITNQDGVVMVIYEDSNGDPAGNITVDGVEHATITTDNDISTVNFSDGSFVSLQ